MAHEDLVADRDFWKKRALAPEQERDTLEARLFASQAAYDDLARETGLALDKAWSAKNAAEARVAELEAGINALADKWEWTYVGYVRRFLVPALRALTEKGD